MKKGVAYVLLSFFLIANIYSQRVLTLDECRELAIENNKSLKMADQAIRNAYYQKKDAITKYFPELSFSGMYLRNQKNLYLIPSSIHVPEITIPGVISIPPSNVHVPDKIRDIGKVDIKNIWVGGFNLVQPIFMGGKIIAYNDIQKYAEELAKTQKDIQLTTVIVEVDNAYWQVVSLSNKHQLAESYVALMQKMERDIKIMEAEGVATKADRLSVSVKLNEAEMSLTKVENGLSLAKMFLCQVCGLPIDDNIVLREENAENLNVTEQYEPLPDVNEAFAKRSEIKSLELATKMYKKSENIALSEFLPQLGFTANYLWTNPSGFNGFDTKFGGMWSIGLSLKVPLNFFSSSAKLNAAKAKTFTARYQLEDAKEKIELQVNQTAYKIKEANKKLRMSSKNMEKADENLRYANVGFREGVIPASDVMAAHTAWVSAHSDYIDAQIESKLARAYYDQALGRTLYEK